MMDWSYGTRKKSIVSMKKTCEKHEVTLLYQQAAALSLCSGWYPVDCNAVSLRSVRTVERAAGEGCEESI